MLQYSRLGLQDKDTDHCSRVTILCRRLRRRPCTQAPTVPSRFPAADWRHKARPIPPGGNYPAKEHCSHCGLW